MSSDSPWTDEDGCPNVPICQSCKRIVYRADGHRCDVLRDYEWMRGHR